MAKFKLGDKVRGTFGSTQKGTVIKVIKGSSYLGDQVMVKWEDGSTTSPMEGQLTAANSCKSKDAVVNAALDYVAKNASGYIFTGVKRDLWPSCRELEEEIKNQLNKCGISAAINVFKSSNPTFVYLRIRDEKYLDRNPKDKSKADVKFEALGTIRYAVETASHNPRFNYNAGVKSIVDRHGNGELGITMTGQAHRG